MNTPPSHTPDPQSQPVNEPQSENPRECTDPIAGETAAPGLPTAPPLPPLSGLARSARLDKMLTGLAMFDAYTDCDLPSLEALTSSVDAGEAVESLLATMDAMTGMLAVSMGISRSEVTESVRRRVLREIATGARG